MSRARLQTPSSPVARPSSAPALHGGLDRSLRERFGTGAPSHALRAPRFNTEAAMGANILSGVVNAPARKGRRKGLIKSWKFQIERNHELLADADIPWEILEDREFLLRTARANILAMASMPIPTQVDFDFIQEVMHNNPDGWRIFEICPSILQGDRGLMLQCVKGPGQGWRALRFASEELKENSEFMLEVTRSCGTAIEYASQDVSEEQEMVLASIQQYSDAVNRLTTTRSGTLWSTEGVQRDQSAADELTRTRATTEASADLESPAIDDVDGEMDDSICKLNGDASLWYKKEVQASRRESQMAELARKRASEVDVDLQCEFAEARSGAVMTAGGTLQRLVQIVALNVKLQDGRVLVWMGHRKPDGTVVDKCVLPGHKFAEGESPKDAIDTLLNNELRPLASGIVLDAGYKVTTKTKLSDRFRCTTQYYTALFDATMDPAFNWQAVMEPLKVDAIDQRPRLLNRTHESFCRRFCVEGSHARPDMFQLRYGNPLKEWPPINCDWPPPKRDIYAWLAPWEFEWLTTTRPGVSALSFWVSQLRWPQKCALANALCANLNPRGHKRDGLIKLSGCASSPSLGVRKKPPKV